MQVSGNFARLLEPGLREIFSTQAGRPDPMRDMLYRVIPSGRRWEEYQGIGSMGLVRPYQGAVETEDFDAYFEVTIRNYLLTKGLIIERQLLEDDQTGTINSRATAFGDTFQNTQEFDASTVFTNAFTDTGVDRIGQAIAGADAVGLCSLVHPDSPRQSGNTQANEDTLVLSRANVNTTRQAMRNFTDDKGELMGVNPDTYLGPAELEEEAAKIFDPKAVFQPDSAEFNVNIFAGRLRPLTWNRLTDADAWFLIDSRLMKRYLIWQQRINPMFERASVSNTEIAQFNGRMRYGRGWLHWAWLFGNNPA